MAEGVGSGGSEDRVISSAAGPAGGAENGKLDVASSELDGSGSSDFLLLIEDSSSDDGNGVGGGPVVTGHLSVELADCTVE